MFDPRLLAKLNLGRCFAFVGSGPSCEMGYPSWQVLASRTYEHLKSNGKVDDHESYERYLGTGSYPELFKIAEFDIGGRNALCRFLKQQLTPTSKAKGSIYELLVSWPFSCYLTTNYDNELVTQLESAGYHYAVRQNRPEDLALIRHDSTGLIVKLHGDFDHPSDVILTSEDYHRFSVSPTGEYFRATLRACMQMFDVCIIGHSLADFDIKLILQAAKDFSSPSHPVFWFAANLTRAQQREFYERYNIAVVPYDNSDGRHTQLKRILLSAGKYIARRDNWEGQIPIADPKEIEAATALLLFRRLQPVLSEGPSSFFAPLVLQAVAKSGGDAVNTTALKDLFPLSMLCCGSDPANVDLALNETVETLTSGGSLRRVNGSSIALTQSGRARFSEITSTRELEREQALGQFSIAFKKIVPDVRPELLSLCNTVLESTVVEVFRSRGLAIANSLFRDATARPDEMTDIFAAVSRNAASLPSLEVRAAFVESAHDFLLEPNEAQKRYLTSLSQGYFLYHMVGLDPTCSKLRHQVFRDTVWFCDSNFILPLIAQGCVTHAFSLDLFHRLRSASAKLFVTVRMLREAWEHFQWAARLARNNSLLTPTFLAAALGAPGYDQNVFLDGFVRLTADGIVSTFEEYSRLVCSRDVSESGFAKQIVALGIKVTAIELLEGYQPEDSGECEYLADRLTQERTTRNTYRSPSQVEAEAEVLQIVHRLRDGTYRFSPQLPGRVYFVSNSLALDRASDRNERITWAPEAVYRYLISLPGVQPEAELLQECMLRSYQDAGVNCIDRKRFLQVFGPYVNAARASLQLEKERYLDSAEAHFGDDLEETFERTPDLEKPLFVHKIGLRILEISSDAAKEAVARADTAERQVRILLEEKDRGWRRGERERELQLRAEAHNKLDPKHVRKRLKQKKERSRKKLG